MRLDALAPHQDPAADIGMIDDHLYRCNSGVEADGDAPQSRGFDSRQS